MSTKAEPGFRAAARTSVALLTLVVALPLAAVPASAIECVDASQRIRPGEYIVTPYCADNYLAKVARSYGTKVTDAEVRNNPSTKREICRFIGHDTRVQHICQGYRDGPEMSPR